MEMWVEFTMPADEEESTLMVIELDDTIVVTSIEFGLLAEETLLSNWFGNVETCS